MDRILIHCLDIGLKSAFHSFKSAILASPLPFALGTIAALLLAPCSVVNAEQLTKIPRVGFLIASSPSAMAPRLNAFQQGLLERGYVEGKNIVIERRHADGKADRLPALAAETNES